MSLIKMLEHKEMKDLLKLLYLDEQSIENASGAMFGMI